MPFNLIRQHWLPVKHGSGRRERVRPADLASAFFDDPIVALDFPRPDWNAAVTEWLIGITFLALRPANDEAWAERFADPPAPDELSVAFAPFAFAFDLDGEGPRAFQDFDPLDGAEPKPISGLLMDAPGENTLKNNADLFIKRGGADALGLPCAAAALITLQTYAPSGGAGHRTSLRGGGPLTTLVAPRRKGNVVDIQTLWDRVWANTPSVDFDAAAPDGRKGPSSPDWAKVFPWLAPTLTSQNERNVTPEDATLALAFFACPRRIRLNFSISGVCALTGEAGPVATGLRTVNYGANYLAWTHPLSPYRQDKKSGVLPLHPHAGASDYGDCAAWWGLEDDPALVLKLWDSRRKRVGSLVGPEGVEAFGFDMDNMKARQWLEVRLPWAPVYGRDGRDLRELLRQIIGASDRAAQALRYAAKIALYGQRQKAGGYRLPDTLPLNALPEPAEQLWRETDGPFRELVDKLIREVDGGGGPGASDLKAQWLSQLRAHGLRLFAEAVDLDGLTDSNPHRLLWARDGLGKALSIAGPAAKVLQIAPSAAARAKKEPA